MSSRPLHIPPPMHNSHEHGSRAALRVLLASILMWESMYRMSGYAMKFLVDKYPRWILDPSLFPPPDDENDAARGKGGVDRIDGSRSDDARRTLIELGPSYAVSLVHSMYATCRGIMHLYHLWDASSCDKFVIPPGGGGGEYDVQPSHQYHRWAHLLVARTNILFLSYLLYDLCHVLHRYPKLGGIDTVMHHVLFAMCACINGTYGLMAFAFGWLACGEGSTILLNLRWFVIKSGRGSRPILNTINILFAIAFFYVRVGIYTAGVVHLFLLARDDDDDDVGRSVLWSFQDRTGVPMPLLGLTCGCILLGWGLNLLWGFKIMAMIGGKGSGGDNNNKKRQ
ncbi:hypothetical protein ACHAXA_002187 [Cyclostephanos tholiformis]|uniref:TLC domain-containing protein n=1 Tax=Cyclostephanos tholiformis TaxID=382380 RepID=A0ABD3RVJ4_9STRA